MTAGRRSIATFVACAAISCGGGAPTPTGPSGSLRPPVTVRVMTFNIQHGIDGNGRYNLQNAVAVIAAVQPDIVGLQEVTRNHPSYACDDQPARIAAGVQAATGRAWTVEYQQEWFTPDVSCRQSGRGDGPETEGLALLSTRSIAATRMTALADSRIGLQTSIADAYGLPVVVTHLTSGSGGGAVRAQQIAQLTSWATQFGAPRVVMGDFNAAPSAQELQPLLTAYHDAWSDAAQSGRAGGNPNSHGSARIDYVFYAPAGALTVASAQVVDTVPIVGVAASDHSPVVATFTVR